MKLFINKFTEKNVIFLIFCFSFIKTPFFNKLIRNFQMENVHASHNKPKPKDESPLVVSEENKNELFEFFSDDIKIADFMRKLERTEVFY